MSTTKAKRTSFGPRVKTAVKSRENIIENHSYSIIINDLINNTRLKAGQNTPTHHRSEIFMRKTVAKTNFISKNSINTLKLLRIR